VTDAPPGEPPADPRDALIREQAQRIEAQARQIAVLETLVADLRERLAAAERAGSRNSGNSSMPPSSDDLPGRKQPRKQRAAERAEKKKRRGKQPGSPGAAMRWEVPDRTEDHYPQGECSCGRGLADAADLGVARSISRRRSRPRRRSGCSTTCTRHGAPAAGSMSRRTRRACRTWRCPSGRGCVRWLYTWSSSSMSRWSGAGT